MELLEGYPSIQIHQNYRLKMRLLDQRNLVLTVREHLLNLLILSIFVFVKKYLCRRLRNLIQQSIELKMENSSNTLRKQRSRNKRKSVEQLKANQEAK